MRMPGTSDPRLSPDYTDGGLRVSDGKHSFFNAADGSVISSKEKFQNFVLQFDVPYIEREGQEDDDGNITRTVSTWIGLTFGMESAETLFSAENQKMIYMGPGTIDLLNAKFDDGSTRIWAPQDLWNMDFARQNRDGPSCCKGQQFIPGIPRGR